MSDRAVRFRAKFEILGRRIDGQDELCGLDSRNGRIRYDVRLT